MTEATQYCSFFVGDHYFGVDVREVQEVIRYQEMTRVPLASPVITGLINLRGQIVTAIDLRRRLGLPNRAAGKLPMNVVIRTDDGPLSLLVDEIGDVLEVKQDAYEPPPETLQGVARQLIHSVYRLQGKLLLALDTAVAVQVPSTTDLTTEPLSRSASSGQ